MADYGKKFICFKCGGKFYNLHKPKAVCPKCGSDQAEAPKIALRLSPAPSRRPHPSKKVEKFPEAEVISHEEVEDAGDSEEDNLGLNELNEEDIENGELKEEDEEEE